MSYKKATQVLPQELLLKVQEYIDGEFIYIPRISDNKKAGEQPLQFVKNCTAEMNVFMQNTLLGNVWNLWLINIFCP